MTQIRFIGDTHGKYRQYRNIIRPVDFSIQVGDMGVGFRSTRGDTFGDWRANPPYQSMNKPGKQHLYIRGNHDNPNVCRMQKNFIPDGTYWDDLGMMFIGGATSIDTHLRTEGFTWWADEQLSYSEFMPIVDKYLEVKPRIMITHDCPQFIAEYMNNRTKLEQSSRTRQCLQTMWEAHKPELWIFGHWHFSYDKTLLGTRFLCLAELEYKDIEI